jgi:amino acid transporter
LKNKFGTAPVFFTAISTILGAILFLRFGYAVGNVGFLGVAFMILIGHAVTIPTAMAIAEIATNQKVEGGGEYYIISRSFGVVIGSTIGIALFFSQAISVAFYVMAFSEAFTPFFQWVINTITVPGWLQSILMLKQIVGIPALLILTFIMLTKGADLGVKALYIVVLTLAISLMAFFIGQTDYSQTHRFDPMATIADSQKDELIEDSFQLDQDPDGNQEIPSNRIPIGFFTVFAIIFPAFTGMTAGVGLSGDLKDPGRSIPIGTLTATIAGMIIYFFIAFKFSVSAPPDQLADTSKLAMANIAWQGWLLVPVGLAAATISSALGSIMVAPRTLQAIAGDKVFPTPRINNWLAEGKGETGEPYHASIITIIIAAFFIMLGGIDVVAKIISMFFMVTYGSLCLISFLNHFAADPSYRPRFKSRWYISFFGAIACFALMFFMNAFYAFLAVVIVGILFYLINQFNQDVHVFLQKSKKEEIRSWRPSAIAVSESSFLRLGLFDLLSWISEKYGFGTYIHLIRGYLSKESNHNAIESKERLIQMAGDKESNILIDTIVSPSYTSTIAQVIQLPGIAGTENNLLLLEFSKNDPTNLKDIIDNLKLVAAVDFDLCILSTSERGFGLKKHIHIWITANDYANANLMILLAYILLGHKDWKGAEIGIFAVYDEEVLEEEKLRLNKLITAGQLPISEKNIQLIPKTERHSLNLIIQDHSRNADLTLIGFMKSAVKHLGPDVLEQYDQIGNILFVSAAEQIDILPQSVAKS